MAIHRDAAHARVRVAAAKFLFMHMTLCLSRPKMQRLIIRSLVQTDPVAQVPAIDDGSEEMPIRSK